MSAAAASEQRQICCRVSVSKHPCSARILIFGNSRLVEAAEITVRDEEKNLMKLLLNHRLLKAGWDQSSGHFQKWKNS